MTTDALHVGVTKFESLSELIVMHLFYITALKGLNISSLGCNPG